MAFPDHNPNNRACHNGGFTYIELMVTLAIMGILVLVATPMAQISVQRDKEHELRVSLVKIREALDAYKRAAEQGHIIVKVGDSGYPKKLDDLADGVLDQRSPNKQKLYFLRQLPRDPFNPDTSLKPSATWGIRSFTSPPDDPSEGDDVFDIHTNSQQIGLNGVPYKQW